MSGNYIEKFGKVRYDATVDIASPRFKERLEWRRRYIRMNFALSLFLFGWLLLLSLASSEKNMIVLPFILFIILSLYLLYLSREDPRVKVVLTENGIFYGYERMLGHVFISYEEIVAVEYAHIYLSKCLRVVKKPVGLISRRGVNIPLEDIKNLNLFLLKLKEKVPPEVFKINV